MFSRLAQKLLHLFPQAVRSRGEDYYRRGLVKITGGSPVTAEAIVRGSANYEVELDWDSGALAVYCSCPYADSDGPCKHIWATVLAAESRGYLNAIGAVRTILHEGFDDDPDDLDFDYEEDDPLSGTLFEVPKPAPPPKPSPWKAQIAAVGAGKPAAREWPARREIIYAVDARATLVAGHAVLSLSMRDRKANGTFARATPLRLDRNAIPSLPDAGDREILAAISGAAEYHSYSSLYGNYGQVPSSITLRHPLSRIVIPLLLRTGRCCLGEPAGADNMKLLTLDEGAPWTFELSVDRAVKGKDRILLLTGALRRDRSGGDDAERADISEPHAITQGREIFLRDQVSLLAEDAPLDWLLHLRRTGPIEVPEHEADELLAHLLCAPGAPRVRVPPELRYDDIAAPPRPCVRVRPGEAAYGKGGPGKPKIDADLSFEYEGRSVRALEKSPGIYDAATRRFFRRDRDAEEVALRLFHDAGGRFREKTYYQPDAGWEMLPSKLPGAVTMLLGAGWHVEIEGKVFRKPGEFRISVTSGLDWFELKGDVEYGETSAKLPELLEAVRRGENIIRLGDGSYGMVPEELLRRIALLSGMGTAAEGHIRFRPSQAGLLDALLAAQPEATFDAAFARMRQEMRGFRSVEALEQPAGFVGQLRDYQREGLGWMAFLRRFSFGGCLADDMGVGKTAQVLALLESRRELAGPSLVVVPRSLLFNWKREAERFTPLLRVLDYAGTKREAPDFSGYDLVLVTYGTLRRDAARLKDIEFDYVVLDEAQAVKNATTESAKAVRLLRGAHRLALSGTPVENHIGELWSLFEFLNPGMLGAAGVFKLATGAGKAPDEEARKLLSMALRPFILRRTKDQVARELPAKTEQTIYCELDPPQRKLYDELRQHYRDSLLKRIATEGLAKSKIMVLEALLRLRQAACHPGLIDVKRSAEPSAKLEALQEQLREVLDAGHKALVFSQFTSLLKIVRNRLDAEGVVYEYLDGRTRDRQAHVERFQSDPKCGLFLISLKAGGLGLNLTAADYVFLLDPWWNPAVEAQAVDRAHRIGQTRSVFAYRLIARDTVEEKVLELQKSKRDLAAAIVGEDNALIRDLKREDLELLLS